MKISTKALVVVHRAENAGDFKSIADRMRKMDPSVAVAMMSEILDPRLLPPVFLTLPMLVVYLVNPPPTRFAKASKIAVRSMDKCEEYLYFRRAGLPCLPIEHFRWGMTLDRATYGDWVVLKPANMTSTGKDINMVPTRLLSVLKSSDFPGNHLIHQDDYLVQRLLKTGSHPTIHRVTVFLDEIMYSIKARLNIPYPSLDSDLNVLLTTSVASNQHALRTREFIKDEKVNAFALKVAATFPDNPLFGIDILRDEVTGQLFVLEVNLGGNVWHFSSAAVRGVAGYGREARKAMILQYNAWDRAAEALLRKTHALAS